jgi:hypothetical protein
MTPQIRLAAARTKDAVVALELAAGECGSGAQPGLAQGEGTTPCQIADNGRDPTLQFKDSIDWLRYPGEKQDKPHRCPGFPQTRIRRNRLRRCTVQPAGDSSAQIRFSGNETESLGLGKEVAANPERSCV